MNTNWSMLTALQVGRYAEYYAKMEFTSYGFDVYTSEVDDHGVDFIAKNAMGDYYEVQVKSVRNDNYVFIRKDKIQLDDKHLVCFIRYVDGELPESYVFPSMVWNDPDGALFISRDYEGLKSAPEYGLNVKGHMAQLKQYDASKILPSIDKRR